MATVRCAYGKCNTDGRLYRKKVRFFRFPDKTVYPVSCLRWVEACGRPGFGVQDVRKNTYLCSRHFYGVDGPTADHPDPIVATSTTNHNLLPCESAMVEPLLSVVTQCPLPSGAVVGAMPSPPGSLDHLVLIGLRCLDVRPPGHTLKVDPRKPECPEAPLCSEWLLHVQSARDIHEQNLEAVAHEGRLYARTTRPVKADEELLLWYGAEVARALGMPGPNALLLKGESKYSCPFCSEVFLYPNPCSAHVIYRCDQKRSMPPLEKPLADNPGNYPRLTPEKNASAYTIEFLSSSSNHSERSPSKTEKASIMRTSSHVTAPKRRLESRNSGSPDSKRLDLGPAREGGEGGVTPDGSGAEAENQAPLTDHNQNVKGGTPGTTNGTTTTSTNGGSPLRPLETGSAFKKVHKGGACLPMDVPASSAKTLCTLPFSTADAFMGPASTKTLKGAIQLPMSMVTQAPTLTHLSCPPPGLFPPPSIPSAFAPAKGLDDPMTAYTDAKIVVGVMDEVLRLPRGFPDHHSHPPAGAYKLPMHYGKPHFVSGGGVEPPPNKFQMPPPVASLLPPSLTALGFPAQNWCAKCNASFRMTSDLVYHMRSHHKREVDPAKKRRDEKLKCQICNESFRERHHLTRHMTSHQ